MRLTLPSDVMARMRAAAEAAFPEEACGLLIGSGAEGGVRVEDMVPSANVAGDPARCFEVDPALHLRLQRELRGTERQVIGHYHSHPDGVARPSAEDVARIADPAMVWVILSVTADGVADPVTAWRVQTDSTGFEEMKLEMT